MAQHDSDADATNEHNETITSNFGAPGKLYERYVRGAEGFYNVSPVEGTDGDYTVERDGSDHVYNVNVREMECDCGDKKGLCKHLWRVMFETGELPEIGVNVAANTSTEDGGRPPSVIVLNDDELSQMLDAADILSVAGEVEAAFDEENGEHVGELDSDLKGKVVDTLEMACGSSGFGGPTTDKEIEAANNARDAVESAEAV